MSLAEKIHEGMKKHHAKHSKGDKNMGKGENKTGVVDHFEIHPADGGHVLETHFKHKGSMLERPEMKKSVHKNMSSAMKEMKSSCGCGNCGEPDTGIVAGEGSNRHRAEDD
jgi:hypothetical protein